MNKVIYLFGKDFNVYATVEDADLYFSAMFGNNWAEIGEIQKAQLLITATRQIDRQDFQGVVVDEEQPLKLPRIIAGKPTDDDLVTEACCELALQIYQNGNSNVNVNDVQSVSLGDSKITFKDDAVMENTNDLLIENYLGNYLIGGVRVIL